MPGEEMEYFPCPKMYMGRVIGQRGVTINDLQRRSNTDIQINQDVPPGMDCQISLRGTREGIEAAKAMLREIIDSGPGHPYAGGHGATGTGGLYPNGLASGPTGTGPAQPYYQQHPQHPATPSGVYHPPPGPGGYGHPPPQQYSPPAQAPQQYGHFPYGGAPQGYGPGPGLVPHPEAPPPPGPAAPPAGPWKTATAADGQTYYYNEATGESKWDKPVGML